MGSRTGAMESPRFAPAPRANPYLAGHESAVRALAVALRSRRLHHAWLFTGPRGIGKATLAFRFARYLLAAGDRVRSGEDAPSEARSLALDPAHPVFRRVASGGHADLYTVERGYDEKQGRRRQEIVVGDVRGIGDLLALTAAEGGWRVVVVDDADDMNRNAANAILKVLEEPPERTLLLLVAHAPGRLPATIRSRCRKLVLAPLSDSTVRALLLRYRQDLASDEAATLARLAGGSIGLALDLAEEGGLDLYRELVSLLEPLPSLDVARLHAFSDRLARKTDDTAYTTTTALLLWWLGRLIRAGATGRYPQDVVEGEGATVRRLLDCGGLDRWIEVCEKIRALLVQAESVNLDRKQVLLSTVFALQDAARG